MTAIYHDNGAAFGRRTRFFRDAADGGVEWMYGVDYANGDTRWYGYLCTGRQESIASLKADGMFLSRLDNGNTYRTELTPAGEQAVIPGCERNFAPGKRQLDLFG